MKKIALVFLLFIVLIGNSIAQTEEHESLLALDLGWEKALLNSDVAFLENFLAEDFIWVHNHASLIDSREEVIKRAKRIQAGLADNTKSRISKDQKVILFGNTGVVSGITLVDRPPSPVTYHFMRTYVKMEGKFWLLANHTMAIPDEDLK
ncbi:nuclear transport factor 2 family protein [Cecembia sp.]|uniref:nuclear transport factor 2 family protein n=1 Tax=Cecembia sp. TaxID=1898110 RepID=UPI0025BF408E|nr:nuclear transport factor 2 family protein [Cecembia sp.]